MRDLDRVTEYAYKAVASGSWGGRCLRMGDCVTGRGLWHRLLRRSASESGRLCHGDGGHEGGDRRRRVLVSAILCATAGSTSYSRSAATTTPTACSHGSPSCSARAWSRGEDMSLLDLSGKTGGPRISTADSPVSGWVVPTNEELLIARHTLARTRP